MLLVHNKGQFRIVRKTQQMLGFLFSLFQKVVRPDKGLELTHKLSNL